MKKKNPKIKLKTRKSVAKRFRVTKTGKVLRRAGGIRHLAANRTKTNRRRTRGVKGVIKPIARKIRRMLGK